MQAETREQRFKRLAKSRVEKVADSLRKLSNLASPNYEYSDPEVENLFRYIDSRIKEAKQRFTSSGRRGIPEFEWPPVPKSGGVAENSRSESGASE